MAGDCSSAKGAETEVQCASKWLASEIVAASASADDRKSFESAISVALAERYAGHWYPDEPHRGCAFRSVECSNGRLDPLLVAVARQAKVAAAAERDFMLWVNPGEVKVVLDGARKHLFCEGAAPNPYSRALVTIKRTRLDVAIEDTTAGAEYTSSVSSSASDKGSDKDGAEKASDENISPSLSPFAAEFTPGTPESLSQSSEPEVAFELPHAPPAFVHSLVPPPPPPPPQQPPLPPGLPMGQPPLPPGLAGAPMMPMSLAGAPPFGFGWPQQMAFPGGWAVDGIEVR